MFSKIGTSIIEWPHFAFQIPDKEGKRVPIRYEGKISRKEVVMWVKKHSSTVAAQFAKVKASLGDLFTRLCSGLLILLSVLLFLFFSSPGGYRRTGRRSAKGQRGRNGETHGVL